MNNNELTVLIVEDEKELSDILVAHLSHAFMCTHVISDGNLVIEWLRNNHADVVLLDLMLPNKDGLAICKELREFSNVPVIMLTAKVEEIDRLIGFKVGADDYVCKPYSAKEIIARIQSVIRRFYHSPDEQGSKGWELDEKSHSITYRGTSMTLSGAEFRIVYLLFKNSAQIFSRSHILDILYSEKLEVSERVIDNHIRNIRKKVRLINSHDEVIRSVYGVGYQFGCSVR